MSDAVEKLDQPVITQQQAALAIMNYFLANAEVGNHAANDELIVELGRWRRDTRPLNSADTSGPRRKN